MKLNAKTDFLYSPMFYVALHSDRLVTARQIAEAYGLSHNHISKVCQELIRHRFLKAQRGRGDGVRLAREPEDIKLGELLYPGDTHPKVVDCDSGVGGVCRIATACRLKGILAQAQRAFVEVLNSHSLAEVISQPKLISLFDPPAPK